MSMGTYVGGLAWVDIRQVDLCISLPESEVYMEAFTGSALYLLQMVSITPDSPETSP